jgi:hypothetical protein
VNPNARFALVALGALAMSASSLMACVRGDLDLPEAGLRYVIAFVVARVGVGIVDILLTGYRRGAAIQAAQAAAREREVLTPTERDGHPLRRGTDLADHGILEIGVD